MNRGDDSYVPKGPAESGRIRAYAEAKLRHLSQAHDVLNDKTKFMLYMESLTNDILGVGSRRTTPTAKVGTSVAREHQTAPSSSSSSSSEQSAYVPQVISNDMREASYSALGKLQQIRRNVATVIGGGGDSRALMQEASWHAEVRHVESGYPFRAADGRQTATQITAQMYSDEGRENEMPAAPNVQDSLSLPKLHREPSSPVREASVVKSFDLEAHDSDGFSSIPPASVPTTAATLSHIPVPVSVHASHAAEPAPAVRDAAPVPGPRMNDGELDFSGSWKGRPERGRYQETESASVKGWAPRLDAAGGAPGGSPRPTLSMRGSVDLSAMTLDGFKDLTGHLP